MVAQWLQHGYTHAVLSMWVTNLSEVDVASLPNKLSDLGQDCLVQYADVHLPEINDFHVMVPHFREVFTASFELRRRAFRGRYLRLIVPAKSLDGIHDALSQGEAIANKVALLLGTSAVADLVYQSQMDLVRGVYLGNCADSEYLGLYGKGNEVDTFYETSASINFDDAKLLRLSALSNQLLHQAIRHINESISFFYLWSTIEIEIGGGASRSKFCRSELNSIVLDTELKRLHDVRNKMTHDGNLSHITGRDKAMALEFIRLRLIIDSEQRKLIVDRLENLLTSEPERINIGGSAESFHIEMQPVGPPGLQNSPQGPLVHPFLQE
jgi:hypothetical protein